MSLVGNDFVDCEGLALGGRGQALVPFAAKVEWKGLPQQVGTALVEIGKDRVRGLSAVPLEYFGLVDWMRLTNIG
jgi:hypothetical protein